MKMKHALAATATALLLTGGFAHAQQTSPGSEPGAKTQTMPDRGASPGASSGMGAGALDSATLHEITDNKDQVMAKSLGINANDLEGMDIYGADGKKIGDVGKVLADSSKDIKAVTVDVGGFLGIGAREVIVPIDRLQKGTERDRLQTSLTKAQFEKLDQWEDKDRMQRRGTSPGAAPDAPRSTEPSTSP